MSNNNSYLENLENELEIIKDLILDLIEISEIKRRKKSRGIVVVAPDYYFKSGTKEQKQLQLEINKRYKTFVEQLDLLFINSTPEIERKSDGLKKRMNNWIELHSIWGLKPDKEAAKDKFLEVVDKFREFLEVIEESGEQKQIIVPDTNGIVNVSNLENFRNFTDKEDFEVIITPTVLSELDQLKIKNVKQSFRNKVNSTINRIKGLRKQGSLIKGVTVDKSITFKMIASEPDFQNTLSWLQKNNNDDRIIASILEILRENPTAKTLLLTSDINLQNKAEMANIPFIDYQ